MIPAIVKLNSALTVTLPAKDIVVVHRSDGSGTSFIFTDYLSAVSDEWKTKVGKNTSVQWPVGLGGKGNEGVAGTVSQNDGAIGYVELAYAHQNKMAIGPDGQRSRHDRHSRRRQHAEGHGRLRATCPTRWPARS